MKRVDWLIVLVFVLLGIPVLLWSIEFAGPTPTATLVAGRDAGTEASEVQTGTGTFPMPRSEP